MAVLPHSAYIMFLTVTNVRIAMDVATIYREADRPAPALPLRGWRYFVSVGEEKRTLCSLHV